jgi:tetratricopeptide (TPR) repeat protein
MESFEDDFTTILPMFYYEDESVQQTVSPQMKRAIDKATKVITFHSITAKPKVKRGNQSEKQKAFYEKNEYNKWVDDSYMLIGKSYMYQGEFFLASETFKHVIKNFPEEETYYLALTWLARAYSITKQYDEAEKVLTGLRDLEDYPEKYRETYYTTLADYHIRLGEYDAAEEYIEKALDTRPKKYRKIRYTYILAQLYQETGDSEASIRNFRRVVRMNPPYVMSFNAKVNMAESYQAGVSGSGEIKKLLNKMMKDSKNKEYLDQIYFALGNIAMEEGDREQAIDYYHKSVSSSVQNTHQKGESCLTLAKIYYEEPVYTLSAAYYDTAMNLLDTDYPDYERLKLRSLSLNTLSNNIQTFELQDSVQRLAALPEAERNAIIDGIIADVREQEAEAQRKQQEAMQDLAFNRTGFSSNTGYGTNQQSGGKWYFYNLNAKSFGQPEFRMKWGDRKLEDNWRRSNKQSMSAVMNLVAADSASSEGVSGNQILDNKSREYYLKDIPLTDSAMEVSHRQLEEALHAMGMIYKDELFDYDNAIASFEELVTRYPRSFYAASSLYYLYTLYTQTKNDAARANVHRASLLNRFPDSHYANLISNPNYLKQLEEEESKADRFYEQVYENYQSGNFSQVIRLAEEGMETYPEETEMIQRLMYLRAMSIGASGGKERMKEELDSLIALYPGSDIASEARDVVEYMFATFPVIREAEQEKVAKELYTFDSTAIHYFGIALKKSQDINLINFNLINYNIDYFNAYDLTLEMKEIDDQYNLIVVRGFSDFGGVKRYADRIRADRVEVMGEIPETEYRFILISDKNFTTLQGARNMVPYLLFYRNQYAE